MEVKVIKKEKNYLEIELVGEDISFANALRGFASENEDVEFASCNREHPQIGNPKIILRTVKKNPLKILEAAAKTLSGEAEKFQKAIKPSK